MGPTSDKFAVAYCKLQYNSHRRNLGNQAVPTVKERAIAVFRNNGGLLRSTEARRLGIHPQTLKRMTDEGILEKPERGLYHLKGFELQGDSDMIFVAKLVPKAVFCLISALHFHK